MKEVTVVDNTRKAVLDGLSRVLADSYALYIKTHGHHWNVTGPNFPALHAMFEDQYTELAGAVDQVAERIRALGAPAPAGYKAFQALTAIEEKDGALSAEEMVADLLDGHRIVARTAKSTLEAAEAADDQVTVDLMVQRMAVHDKTAWMLQSTLA
jgi:starvation-inducible DNA-binding protein